jgi:hypothetical protein
MRKLQNFKDDLKAMFSSPQTPTSQKPSMDPRRISIAVLFCAALILGGIGFGYLWHLQGNSGDSKGGTGGEIGQTTQTLEQEGSLVIHFKDGKLGGSAKGAVTRASSGTLVRVRLLNSIETFDTVPVFAQVVDYALGQSFYGWTLVGDATGDGNVARIKMGFRSARSPRGNSSLEIGGQALSLDGTLGVKAEKVEGMTSRALIGGAKSAGGGIANSFKGSGDLSSILMRALLTGLETEITSDMGASYNRSAALRLKPGQEFFVQLTENF